MLGVGANDSLSCQCAKGQFIFQHEASAHDLQMKQYLLPHKVRHRSGSGFRDRCLWVGALAGAVLQVTTPMILVS
jgi:hypothetical protein